MPASAEQRHGETPMFDNQGQPTLRLVCRFEDPSRRTTFDNGRIVRRFPLLMVSSPRVRSAECKAVADLVIDTARGTSVTKEMCDLQIMVGSCPRGFTEVDLPDPVKNHRVGLSETWE